MNTIGRSPNYWECPCLYISDEEIYNDNETITPNSTDSISPGKVFIARAGLNVMIMYSV